MMRIMIILLLCCQFPTLAQVYVVTYGAYPSKRLILREAIVTGGTIKTLNHVEHINIRYDYQYMAVGNFQSEAEYLNHILKKKGPVKGQEFIETWKMLPKTCFEPEFEKKFAERIAGAGMTARNSDDTTGITLLVRVTKMKPEYTSEDRVKIPPFVILSCTFFDPENFLVSFQVKAYGSHEPNVTESLGECYRIAGIVLGKKITQHLANAQKKKEQE